MKLTEDIYRNSEEKLPTHAIFIDLSIAFDLVSHNLLLQKLNLRIEKAAFRWFDSYLTNRGVQVKLTNAISKQYQLEGSVPQGSIRGPILVNLCLLNISKCLKKCKILLYADVIVI